VPDHGAAVQGDLDDLAEFHDDGAPGISKIATRMG
jgi:hypothetical protein